jgi:hypothetical protein
MTEETERKVTRHLSERTIALILNGLHEVITWLYDDPFETLELYSQEGIQTIKELHESLFKAFEEIGHPIVEGTLDAEAERTGITPRKRLRMRQILEGSYDEYDDPVYSLNDLDVDQPPES